MTVAVSRQARSRTEPEGAEGFTYERRLEALRATKLQQTQDKQALIGSMDHDDWALILPPEERRKVVQAISTSGMPITDCLKMSIRGPYTTLRSPSTTTVAKQISSAPWFWSSGVGWRPPTERNTRPGSTIQFPSSSTTARWRSESENRTVSDSPGARWILVNPWSWRIGARTDASGRLT